MPLSPRSRRRILVLAVSGTLLIGGLDAVTPQATAPLRGAAGTLFGPIERVLTARDAKVAELANERDEARREVSQLRAKANDETALKNLLASLPTSAARAVPAQVVGYATAASPSGLTSVTIDVGSADGIGPNQSVVSGSALLGRTIRVDRWSSVVQLIGDPSAVVGVRVGSAGGLGSLQARSPAGLAPRSGSQLTVRMMGDATVAVGDEVRTLGSIDGTPYLANLLVGQVISVDSDRGQGGRTAAVRPAAKLASSKFVAVLSASPRAESRQPVGRG